MAQETNPDTRVRVAVIGLGMGRLHAKSTLDNPEAEIVGLADLDENRLTEFKDRLPADRLFTDYKRMLEKAKPDLAIVALPNFLHLPVTVDCLEAGADVVCEKPMALHVGEAQKMRESAMNAGKHLGINFSYRFSREARALKELAEQGVLGEAYHAYTCWTRRNGIPGFGSWFGQKALSGGGPLIDLGVHRIDFALWLMGNPSPKKVFAVTHSRIGKPRAKEQGKKFDVEDLACGMVTFKNGASMLIEVSWAGMQESHERMLTRVTGTRGALVQGWTDAGGGWGKNLAFAKYVFMEGDREIEGDIYTGGWENPRDSIAEFIHAAKNGLPFPTTPEEGIAVQQILDGLYESAETGAEVDVSIDEPESEEDVEEDEV